MELVGRGKASFKVSQTIRLIVGIAVLDTVLFVLPKLT